MIRFGVVNNIIKQKQSLLICEKVSKRVESLPAPGSGSMFIEDTIRTFVFVYLDGCVDNLWFPPPPLLPPFHST